MKGCSCMCTDIHTYASALIDWGKKIGWNGLVLKQHKLSKKEIVYWLEAGHLDNIYFQINFMPCIHAAVYAIPYAIFTGWYEIPIDMLGQTNTELNVSSLSFFHKCHYIDRKAREALLKRYPNFWGAVWSDAGGLQDMSGNKIDYDIHPFKTTP